MIRLFLSTFLAHLAVILISGCGEEAVEGKPAVGYGVEPAKKTSPIDNNLPAPPPLEIPGETD